jgi:hypothetical protein
LIDEERCASRNEKPAARGTAGDQAVHQLGAGLGYTWCAQIDKFVAVRPSCDYPPVQRFLRLGVNDVVNSSPKRSSERSLE